MCYCAHLYATYTLYIAKVRGVHRGGACAACTPLFFAPPFYFRTPPFFAALRTLTMCPHELIFYHKLPTIGTMFGTIFLFISWFVVCWIILHYFQNFRRKLNSLDFIVCPSVQLFAYPSDVTVGFSCLNNFWRFFKQLFVLKYFYLEAKFSRADFYLNILRLKAKIKKIGLYNF